MEASAPTEESFNNQSLKCPKPQLNCINKASIIHNHIRSKSAIGDASFSFNLKPNDSENSIFSAKKCFHGVHDRREMNNNNDQPDVLSMGRLSLSTPKRSVSSLSDDSHGRNYRARSSNATTTTTASSEASWNSNAGLIRNRSKSAPVSVTKLPSAADKTSKKTSTYIRWLFGLNRCPCSGKKSVDVEEPKPERKRRKILPSTCKFHLNKSCTGCTGGCAAFCSTTKASGKTSSNAVRERTKVNAVTTTSGNESTRNFNARPQFEQERLILTDTSPNLDSLHRDQSSQPDSVAVAVRPFPDGTGTTGNSFTFPILSSSTSSSKRVFNVVPPPIAASANEASTIAEVCRNFTFAASPGSRRTSHEDEICSEASSDLFEIESFSTIAAQITSFSNRDSLDEASAIFGERRFPTSSENGDEEKPTPMECCLPSEVHPAITGDGGGGGGGERGEKAGRREGGESGPGPIKLTGKDNEGCM